MKDKLLNKLKKKYDERGIEAVQNVALDQQSKSAESHAKFIETLFYLEKTKRFKEMPRYKDSDFSGYILEVYNMRDRSYRNKRWAVLQHPDVVKDYGFKTPVAVFEKCRGMNREKALREIRKEEEKKKRVLKPSEVKKIVEPFQKPKPVKKKKVVEKTYLNEIDQLRTDLHASNKALAEAHKQIKKLKITVAERDERIKELEGYRAVIETMEQALSMNIMTKNNEALINA